MADINELAERLRPYYSRFLGHLGDTILLTAHSHQAWPDVSREAQLEAWDDAANLIDDKWGKVFGEVLPSFRAHVAQRIGTSRAEDIAVGQNSHELVFRLASCFPLESTVLTTDSEFHSLRRQLDRLAESGATIARVPVTPNEDPNAAQFARRFIEAMERQHPRWVALSFVLFTTGRLIDALPEILNAAAGLQIPVLVDAYHAFNTIPMKVDEWPGRVFVTAGGYKYAQGGEACCWMLLPPDATDLRPLQTGWFADFAHLSDADQSVRYGPKGERFLGSTFDPTAFYRGARVFQFMDEHGLTTQVLREQSLGQTQMIIDQFDALGLEARGVELVTPRSPDKRGGFVTFRSAETARLMAALEDKRLRCDARGDLIRFGPAPYTTATEISEGMLRFQAALT